MSSKSVNDTSKSVNDTAAFTNAISSVLTEPLAQLESRLRRESEERERLAANAMDELVQSRLSSMSSDAIENVMTLGKLVRKHLGKLEERLDQLEASMFVSHTKPTSLLVERDEAGAVTRIVPEFD